MTPEKKGFLNILKPPGMTSHDVVGYLRRLISMRRIGHTGTLDPNAAGVLALCLGSATRLSPWVVEQKKGYRAEITLGSSTDTQDAWGKLLTSLPAATVQQRVDKSNLEKAMQHFTGEIEQLPPMVSAVRHRGRKLYEWARSGTEIERPKRKVEIEHLNLLSFDENSDGFPRALFEVVCSKGTYIRTLCADIGEFLGVGGHMSYLLRTFSGPFRLEDSYTLEEVTQTNEEGKLADLLLPMDYVLKDLPVCFLNDDQSTFFQNGRETAFNEDQDSSGKLLRVYTSGGQFIGLGHVRESALVPHKVFNKE